MATIILETKQLLMWLKNRRERLFNDLESATKKEKEKHGLLLIGQLMSIQETLNFIQEIGNNDSRNEGRES